MNSDEEDFFNDIQPGTSGLTLGQMNNKSSVLCPETQDITSQYLALQQLDAHQKMISRAKGCVNTSPPKSMQSYRSVSSQRKRRMLGHLPNNSQAPLQRQAAEEYNRPSSSSRLAEFSLEEDENRSTDASFVNKAIQTGIPVSNFSCKTAEKISWYLEALSLGELQSEYFSFLENFNHMMQIRASPFPSTQSRRRVIKGDIMDWHRKHFVDPKKPFSPRILADSAAKSKIRDMRCYNPPFRKKKTNSSHSSDTFESYEEDENDEEFNEVSEHRKSSDNSSVEEETLINRQPKYDASHFDTSVSFSPHYRRDYNNHANSMFFNRSEEDKYLDFLSKVTEDILRSGVYSDKAIQQAFEFHMQFYKDDPNKEKLQSLLEQVLEGLKVSADDSEESFQPRKPILFSLSRPNTPPEKEVPDLVASDRSQTTTDLKSGVKEPIDNFNELDNS